MEYKEKYEDKLEKPNGGIVLENFSEGNGFYKVNLAYLSKEQVEEIENIVKKWNPEIESEDERIKACIGMCLTDVCEQRFKDYNTSLKDCLAWLEKVGKNEEIKDGNSIDPHFGKPIAINESKVDVEVEPSWFHHKVDLSGNSEEYRKAYYDGWNNCAQQYIQYKSESNDVIRCLIHGMEQLKDDRIINWGTDKWYMKVEDILHGLRNLEKGLINELSHKEVTKKSDKVGWSEEDEKNLQGIIDEIQANKSSAPEYDFENL